MNCPKCGQLMSIEVDLIGGCQGHCGEDDRCYCDSLDARILLVCNKKLKPPKRSYCNQKSLLIGELGDQYAINRYLAENYRITEKSHIIELNSRY